MKFTLKQLKYVEAAGRLGSIAKAADEMAISQSSIAVAIDGLEKSLEYDLFLRTPAKGITPTPTGDQALSLVRDFLRQSRHFEADLKSLAGDTMGTVRIACYATAAPAFLPPILQNITDRFPDMSVKMMEGDMVSILDFLDQGLVDVVFTYADGLRPTHDFVELFRAPPYALIHVDDPLAQQNSVSFAELAPRPMVMLDLPRTRDYFTGLFERRGHHPNIAHSTRSAEIARALVSGGFGYTILNIRPPSYTEASAGYRAVAISGIDQPHVFGIATLKTTQHPKIVTSFIGSCLELQAKGVFDALSVWADASPAAPTLNHNK